MLTNDDKAILDQWQNIAELWEGRARRILNAIEVAVEHKTMKGFEDMADGSWFISAKVNNEEVWQKVKAGEIKGFSVEGLFNYVPVIKPKTTMEEAVKMIEKILNETNFENK